MVFSDTLSIDPFVFAGAAIPLFPFHDIGQAIDAALVIEHQPAQGRKRNPRFFMDVCQGVIERNGQAKLIQKLPATIVDAGNDLIQSLVIHNLTG